MRGAALKTLLLILDMVIDLRRFQARQWIGRAEWDNMRPERRKAMLEHEYVMVGHDRVYLTTLGLQVLTYKQATG